MAFNGSFQAAASSIEDREQRLEVVAETIEMDFELLGATAIEDKLQEGVPDAIRSLVNAGIKVISPSSFCMLLALSGVQGPIQGQILGYQWKPHAL
jgi:hypothetical protein